jgi:hypothetical protein
MLLCPWWLWPERLSRGIMGFAIGDAHDALFLLFENRGGRIFSAML